MKQFLKSVVLFGICGYIVGIFAAAAIDSKQGELAPVIAAATGAIIGAIRATGQEVCEVVRKGASGK
jgi:outer membrane lipoprotein SlyB